MTIDVIPRMAYVRLPNGTRERRDSGHDIVRCDGVEIGVMGREQNEPLHLNGIPSDELLAGIQKLLPCRTICAPNIVLSENGRPLDDYGEPIDEDDDECPEDFEDE